MQHWLWRVCGHSDNGSWLTVLTVRAVCPRPSTDELSRGGVLTLLVHTLSRAQLSTSQQAAAAAGAVAASSAGAVAVPAQSGCVSAAASAHLFALLSRYPQANRASQYLEMDLSAIWEQAKRQSRYSLTTLTEAVSAAATATAQRPSCPLSLLVALHAASR